MATVPRERKFNAGLERLFKTVDIGMLLTGRAIVFNAPLDDL